MLVKSKNCTVCSCVGEPVRQLWVDGCWHDTYKGDEQHPPYCEHLDDGIPRPPTAKVSVTAKLAMPRFYDTGDDDIDDEDHVQHLANEAWCYMNFPAHFSEHWTGYNLVPPIKDPVPVGAVVPQFYGYYRPEKEEKGKFMSPILLLEHCGLQANMEDLTLEERRECWSLLERLHLGGFVHNSVYERNILIQNGPIHYSPFKRSDLHPRFRLIDFGRCEEVDESGRNAFLERRGADRKLNLDMMFA
ncbi:hypothetical protein SCHPADRAFT_566026 [Schizopora paradoxa]|uniref:Protein kinase domain-containing protein n=1 Tax=Schizopora paradoxa TaxID=27342 RepID=A0A0H2RCA1_9AGAM|nr:hypothetical protein SCHPADRAFT_566026 [Schizopora paradoxa]